MQNSLDRLLGGIAEILDDAVAPEVTDPWVRSQVTAAAELLGQLRVRVTWDVDAMPWLDGCRDAIARAVAYDERPEAFPAGRRALELGPVDGLAAGTRAVEDYVAAHLEALSELAVWSIGAERPPDDLVDAVRSAVDAHAESERALLRAAR